MKWIFPSRAGLDLRLFDLETFPICKVQEAVDELEEAASDREVRLLGLRGICWSSLRGKGMLLSGTMGLSEWNEFPIVPLRS